MPAGQALLVIELAHARCSRLGSELFLLPRLPARQLFLKILFCLRLDGVAENRRILTLNLLSSTLKRNRSPLSEAALNLKRRKKSKMKSKVSLLLKPHWISRRPVQRLFARRSGKRERESICLSVFIYSRRVSSSHIVTRQGPIYSISTNSKPPVAM